MIIKATIAILLLGCLLKMPYGYYQFIRIASCAGFAYLAYVEFKEERIITGLLSLSCAILFNPIFKIYLKRPTWQNIDVIIAILLAIWIVTDLVYLYNGKRQENKA
jgi:hypothetical protein